MKKTILRAIVSLLALAATTSLVCGGEKQPAQEIGMHKSLVGTWQVLRHGVDCVTGEQLNPDFPALMTFNKGGTYIGDGLAPGDDPSTARPEFGVWSHTNVNGNYTFRFINYGYDSTGNYTGRGEISATVTLSADRNSFTYDSTIDVFDADGNLLFSFCGHATGTRFQ